MALPLFIAFAFMIKTDCQVFIELGIMPANNGIFLFLEIVADVEAAV
jgi:hypothetical protein